MYKLLIDVPVFMPNKEVEDEDEFEINKFVAIDDYMWNRTNQVDNTFQSYE